MLRGGRIRYGYGVGADTDTGETKAQRFILYAVGAIGLYALGAKLGIVSLPSGKKDDKENK